MPRARTDINWDAVKVIWLNGQHTSEELGAMFGMSADGIRGRAFRERWNELKRMKQDKTPVLAALPEVKFPASPEEIVERAEKLRGPASFRRRVAEQAERIIDKLEVKEPDSMRELDNFAEVLVKTEKVGARAYGIDSEESRPVINIGVLAGGGEYEPIVDRAGSPGTLVEPKLHEVEDWLEDGRSHPGGIHGLFADAIAEVYSSNGHPPTGNIHGSNGKMPPQLCWWGD